MQTKHLRAQQEEAQRRTKDFQKQLSHVNSRIKQLAEEKEQSSGDRQELIKKKVRLSRGCVGAGASYFWGV